MALTHIRRSAIALALLLQASTALGIGNSSIAERDFVVSGDFAYFEATPRAGVTELWRTDGTGAGTIRIAGLPAETCIRRIVPTETGIAFFLSTRLADLELHSFPWPFVRP
jgi:ELWxxDGT repeat protein